MFYDGPSALDGKTPIIGIATGLRHASSNPKTGPMVQTYILLRDINPIEANRQGLDAAICGDCPLRGHDGLNRACYVPLKWAPFGIWKSFHRGQYGTVARGVLAGLDVRMGTYGDPDAIPFLAWRTFLKRGGAGGWTGYTHQWRRADPRFKRLCMASVTSEAEKQEAQAAGWRTFRVRPYEGRLLKDEVVCPASHEAGRRATCQECQLCRGTSNPAKSVAIYPHGGGRRHAQTASLFFFASAEEAELAAQ